MCYYYQNHYRIDMDYDVIYGLWALRLSTLGIPHCIIQLYILYEMYGN